VSQIYGGGGNAGAPYNQDFIELHNRGETAVDLSGWSVQYTSALGNVWSVVPLSGSLEAGGYFLVGLATGATGTPLPTPDNSGSINLGAGAGKVALVSDSAQLPPIACPSSATVVDLVGYGNANCFEGAGAAPAGANTTAIVRSGLGCDDVNNNAGEFLALAPLPRNAAAPSLTCCADDLAINETDDANEADYCVVQFPTSIAMSAVDTTKVFGRVYEAGVTEAAGDSGVVIAELGYGPRDENPQHEGAWLYLAAAFNVQVGNDDEYTADFVNLPPGTYSYVFRVSLDGGSSWTYCDVDGAGSNAGLHFDTLQLPLMMVLP
jgi:hypothetical protein